MKAQTFFFIAVLGCFLGAFSARAQAPDTLFISTTQVVHLRFASELKYVNLGNKAIVAKIVDGSKDYVAVKAREPFDICTSMSCLESTGEMHTFVVAFAERPARLEVDTRFVPVSPGLSRGLSPAPSPVDSASFSSPALAEIAAMGKELYHIGTRGYGIDIQCENLFYRDDVLYLVVSLRNSSAVSYEISAPRFAVESSRRTKRGLQYEKAVFPRVSYGLGVVAPGTEGQLVFTFDKIALVKGQVFRVYFYEKGGSRNFTMTLGMKDVNEARRM